MGSPLHPSHGTSGPRPCHLSHDALHQDRTLIFLFFCRTTLSRPHLLAIPSSVALLVRCLRLVARVLLLLSNQPFSLRGSLRSPLIFLFFPSRRRPLSHLDGSLGTPIRMFLLVRPLSLAVPFLVHSMSFQSLLLLLLSFPYLSVSFFRSHSPRFFWYPSSREYFVLPFLSKQ